MSKSKFTIDDRKNAPRGFSLDRRETYSTTSFARIKYWHYKKQNFGEPSNVRIPFKDRTVMETEEGMIETEIAEVKISKSVDRASGTFDITLFPSVNWKQKISPGDWLAIYLFNSMEAPTNDSKNLVLLGNVDRVSRSLFRNEDDDRVELRYTLSGRNFGKVFEETDVWYDPYIDQENFADVLLQAAGLEITGNPSEQVRAMLNTFLGPGHKFGGLVGKTSPLKQWRIPNALSKLFGVTSKINKESLYLYDILRKEIEPNLPGYKGRTMLTVDSNGNVYDVLKRCSNELVNMIVIDEVREGDKAFPAIQLRPRPFNTPFFVDHMGARDRKMVKKALNGKWVTLQKMARDNFIEVSPTEIVYENLGKDDHSRMNLFYLTSNRAEDYLRSIHANLTGGGLGNPTMSRESIMRHGLKRYQNQLEFDQLTKAGQEVVSQTKVFKAFMTQIYDMYYANHLYDSGTIECTGVLEAELGKALVIPPEKGVNGAKSRVYFIDGYEHSWKFPNHWKTIFTVTRGQFVVESDGDKDVRNRMFIDVAHNDFGANDVQLDRSYIAQTRVTKK